jgi:class 3 adenylate cyclase
MCFLDLVGYTRLTEEQGDDAAAEIAANLTELTQRAARARGGLPVKWLGDGVMFFFKRLRTVNPAARIAGAEQARSWSPMRWSPLPSPTGPAWRPSDRCGSSGSPDRSGFAWPHRPDVAPGWSAARARLASCAGHWRMRTPVGDNDTRRAACTVSAQQLQPRFRTTDGRPSVVPATHEGERQ